MVLGEEMPFQQSLGVDYSSAALFGLLFIAFGGCAFFLSVVLITYLFYRLSSVFVK